MNTYYHIAPVYHLFGCARYYIFIYIFPIQQMQLPSHPNPHHRGTFDAMNTLHTQPPTHPNRGGNLEPGRYIYICYINIYSINIYYISI